MRAQRSTVSDITEERVALTITKARRGSALTKRGVECLILEKGIWPSTQIQLGMKRLLIFNRIYAHTQRRRPSLLINHANL